MGFGLGAPGAPAGRQDHVAHRGPLALEGVAKTCSGAVAVLARHDEDLRPPAVRELHPEMPVCKRLPQRTRGTSA